LPRSLIFRLNPGPGSRFPLRRSPSVEPASDASGCPLASGLRLCRRSPSESPRTSMPSALLVSARFGVAPVALASSLQRLRCRTRVAPRPASPALPAMDRRVASSHSSFGGAGCESSRFPLRFAPPVSPTISIRVAPNAHPPAPADGMSESPRIAHHPVRLGQVSEFPRFLSLSYDDRPISKSP